MVRNVWKVKGNSQSWLVEAAPFRGQMLDIIKEHFRWCFPGQNFINGTLTDRDWRKTSWCSKRLLATRERSVDLPLINLNINSAQCCNGINNQQSVVSGMRNRCFFSLNFNWSGAGVLLIDLIPSTQCSQPADLLQHTRWRISLNDEQYLWLVRL